MIIGGGTAGLTIANSIQNHFKVSVVEKSKYKSYPFWFKVPLFIGILLRKKNSKYVSKRYFKLANGRNVPFFESNVLGGASVINGCVHMLGNKAQWNSILHNFKFDYDDLIKSYNKIYSLKPKSKNQINLTYAYQNIIDNAFIKVLNKKKIPIGDMNYSDEEACGSILNTSKFFFRTSVMSLFGKKNFDTYIGEDVKKILFDNHGKVTGVRTNLRVLSADYVILSAGVIGTCSLLLDEKANKSKENFLKNIIVGNNVRDHTNLRINVQTNKSVNSLNEISNSFLQKFIMISKYAFGKGTLMTGTGASSAAHLDLDNDGVIDTRIQIVQFYENGRHEGSEDLFSSSKPGFSISITSINPKSKGNITKDRGDINIDPMYLSLNEDLNLLKLALKFCLEVLRSEPICDHILNIEEESTIENSPNKYIVDNIFSGYHLIGGTSDVINSNFEVSNTKNLFICDASIFNKYCASNIHSSVVLISDIFAKSFISKNFQG